MKGSGCYLAPEGGVWGVGEAMKDKAVAWPSRMGFEGWKTLVQSTPTLLPGLSTTSSFHAMSTVLSRSGAACNSPGCALRRSVLIGKFWGCRKWSGMCNSTFDVNILCRCQHLRRKVATQVLLVRQASTVRYPMGHGAHHYMCRSAPISE